MTWLGTTRILYYWMQIPTILGSAICFHEIFIVVSDANNGVMKTPAVNNGHDDVTKLLVTSHLGGML